MATLRLTDLAFGTVGLTITEDIDLQLISQQLSDLLGVPYSFDTLDVTALQDVSRLGQVTATGNSDPSVPDTLVLGDMRFLSPAAANGAGDAVSLIERLQMTDDTLDALAELLVPFFELSEIPTDYQLFIDRDAEDPYVGAGYVRFPSVTVDYYYGSGYYYYYLNVDAGGLDGPDNARIDIDGNVSEFDFSGVTGWQAYVILSDTQDATVIGTGQDDLIISGEGNDSIVGGPGNDALTGGRGVNTVDGGEGDDYLVSTANPFRLDFELSEGELPGAIAIFDGEAEDTLIGGPGNDVLIGLLPGAKDYRGDSGSDTLTTSPGAAQLTGGSESDRFYLAPGNEDATMPFVVGGVPYQAGLPMGGGGSPSSDPADIDTIADFVSATNVETPAGQADLLVAQVEMSGLGSSRYSLDVSATGNAGEPLVIFIDEENQEFFVEIQNTTVIDLADSVSNSDFLIRAVPEYDGFSYSPGSRSLNFTVNNGDPLPEIPASVELVYYTDDFVGVPPSTAFTDSFGQVTSNFDRFFGLQIAATDDPDNPGTVLDGQDKIDLTWYGFTGAAIEDILFTSIDTFENQAYQSTETALDFFADDTAGVDRAVHVEKYFFGEGIDINVYVDTNFSGDFEPFEDLFFQVLDPTYQGGNSLVGDELLAADLYNDPSADGSGSGIFIFNTEQYDLWFDPGLDPLPPPPPVTV